MGRRWWETGVIYQIYPRSFADSTSNGVGDLQGIRQSLDYLANVLGVDAIWLSPFYPSPQVDFGYDVANYTDVDPMFGTLADFDRLLADVHSFGMKLIVDFVPNHSSALHPWFVESRSSSDNPKHDWYTWADAKSDGSPPNNWLSIFGGKAWTWDDTRQQFYLHTFLKEQPDLNWRNPEVVAEMHGAMRFWLDRGVDGFRLDAPQFAMKDPAMRDLPPAPASLDANYKDMGEYDSLDHIYDKNHPDIHEMFRGIRAVLDEYDDRYSVAEIHIFDWDDWALFYGEDLDEAHQPFNFAMLKVHTASELRQVVESQEAAIPPGAWPNYVLGNHDEHRITTRYGDIGVRRMAMMLLTLRGTPTMYFGDEIGMLNADIPVELAHDPWGKRVPGLGRDGCRTPMQWTPDGGFSTSEATWLPMGPEIESRNVASQIDDPSSMLALYQSLLTLRKSSLALQQGEYRTVSQKNLDVFAYERYLDSESLFVALNFSEASAVAEMGGLAGDLVLSTDGDRTQISDGPLVLSPHEGVIIRVR